MKNYRWLNATLLIAGLLGIALAKPACAAGIEQDTWVLLVGCGKYQNPLITSLNFPAADAKAIHDQLVDPKVAGLPEDHVKLLTNEEATKAAIEGAVNTFFGKNVKAGDRIVIYLAGHGVAKGVGQDAKSYYLPTDVKGVTIAALGETAVSLGDLSRKLAQLPASQYVIFSDACREDPVPGRGLKPNTLTDVMSSDLAVVPQESSKAKSITFFACDVGQRAFEDPTFQHGVFTYFILQGLKEGKWPPLREGGQPGASAVEMNELNTYVSENVAKWAKDFAARESLDVEQTPVMLQLTPETGSSAPADPNPVVLVTLHQAPSDDPITPSPPRQLVISLAPRGIGLEAFNTTSPAAREAYQKAAGYEAQKQWELAKARYRAALEADPAFGPAYERLADLQLRGNHNLTAISTLITMVSKLPSSAHAYSLLSQAYSIYVERGAGEDTGVNGEAVQFNGFTLPSKRDDPRKMALNAANAALRAATASAETAEAQLSRGFALVEAENPSKSKDDAIAAFGEAIDKDPNNPRNQYGLGYGLRRFAITPAKKSRSGGGGGGGLHIPGLGFKNPFGRGGDGNNKNNKQDDPVNIDKDLLQQAVTALQKAIELRPSYYEAHHELGLCYQLLGDEDNAQRQYLLADSNRGDASDRVEVASDDVAISCILEKQGKHDAAKGYREDALDLGIDTKAVLLILRRAGLDTTIGDYLPPGPWKAGWLQLPSLPDVFGGFRPPWL